jgi:hypothetical protein
LKYIRLCWKDNFGISNGNERVVGITRPELRLPRSELVFAAILKKKTPKLNDFGGFVIFVGLYQTVQRVMRLFGAGFAFVSEFASYLGMTLIVDLSCLLYVCDEVGRLRRAGVL